MHIARKRFSMSFQIDRRLLQRIRQLKQKEN